MTRAEAVEIARRYAGEWDVPWVGVLRVRTVRAWWYFRVQGYSVEIDTGGRGPAWVGIDAKLGAVVRLWHLPADPAEFPPPPWAVQPLVNMVSMWWRMGSGEVYWDEWCRWYQAQTAGRRAAYQERFPASGVDGWDCFYEVMEPRPTV